MLVLFSHFGLNVSTQIAKKSFHCLKKKGLSGILNLILFRWTCTSMVLCQYVCKLSLIVFWITHKSAGQWGAVVHSWWVVGEHHTQEQENEASVVGTLIFLASNIFVYNEYFWQIVAVTWIYNTPMFDLTYWNKMPLWWNLACITTNVFIVIFFNQEI